MTIGQVFTATLILLVLIAFPFTGGRVPQFAANILIALMYSAVGFIGYLICRSAGYFSFNAVLRFVSIFVVFAVVGVLTEPIFASIGAGNAPWGGSDFFARLIPYCLAATLAFGIELAVLNLIDKKSAK